MIAYGAKLVLKSSKGEREVPIAEFFKGPGQSVIGSDEILETILLEKPAGQTGSAYLKLGVREALEISLVNVAAVLTLDGADGAIKAARVVMGSVGPTHLLSPSAEKALVGEKPSEALFLAAGEAAAMDSKPIDDFRASAEYKRAMVKELTRRALAAAFERAQNQ